MGSKERCNLNLEMNTDGFWRYLKGRFNEDFANLICFDLNLFVPLSFLGIGSLDGLKKHIEHRSKKFSENSLKIFFDYNDENSKLMMNDSSILVINSLRDDVMELFKKKKNASSKSNVTDSTDTANNEDKEQKMKKRKSVHHGTDMKESSTERRKRQIRYRHHGRDEWLFSSDEYILPTLTELNSNSYTNSNFDYQLWTIGRLDYFCTKYFMLKAGAEVRRFIHQAQCQLQMHQEHLYEYFRFIRNDERIMTSLKHYLKKNVPESNDDNLMTRIQLIIGQLVEIKLKFGFTNLGHRINE